MTAILVTAGVIRREGRILVCQRRADGHHPGKWEFPGGKLEPGEDLVTCMRRELHEELGIEAEVGEELWRTRHQYPGRPAFEIVFFAIQSYRGALVNRDFADIRWVTALELVDLDFLDGDREFVAALVGGQTRWS